MNFLYERYDEYSREGLIDFQDSIPSYISNNLKHELRPYQKEAIGRYLYYKDHNKNKDKPEQVLYNMATGSGKTILMAAIILEKFKQGERNFIFFVNNTNIITKTRDNFLNAGSNKYLFTDNIIINGELVSIREVTDFSDKQENSINIVFTTIQQLHQNLNTPRENRLSYEQFKDVSVVLLADEAHHLNAGLSNSEKEENTSWTSTIENIRTSAKRFSIFEFTATIDLGNRDIANKYQESLLYLYDLKAFRLDGYSKDVLFHLAGRSTAERMLQAVLISQYRKKVALEYGINLKPLILFKSKAKADSKKNRDVFLEMMKSLDASLIDQQRVEEIDETTDEYSILKKAFDYFDRHEIATEDLISELQDDFRMERLMLIDSQNKTENKLVELNTLELPTNEIRAIFAVDMLNEGWDVLNLFDIVRLYDTRDGKITKKGFTPGSTTNAEKQLIGRGARYFPFVYRDDIENKYKRKFDNNEYVELRAIEQLHYHSFYNPRYISELKQTLRESGIYDDQYMVVRSLKLKDSFKKSRTYTDGVVWMNKRVRIKGQSPLMETFETSIIPTMFEVVISPKTVRDYGAFNDEEVLISKSESKRWSFKLGEKVGAHVIRHAINRNRSFTFSKLNNAIWGLDSITKFIELLSDVDIRLTSSYEPGSDITQNDKLYIVESLLQHIEKDIDAEDRFKGSQEFYYYPIKEVFDDFIVRKYTINDASNREVGRSQKNAAETNVFEDIDNLDWYAYDDNFGTDEEKYLVRSINDVMKDLEKKWTDIYLLRNEKGVRIYNFDDGQAFEPDFLLFANDKTSGNISWQIFIEPKGSQFVEEGKFASGPEGWKEKFLRDISKKDEARTLVDNERYRIVGLPFYNHKLRDAEFQNWIRNLV